MAQDSRATVWLWCKLHHGFPPGKEWHKWLVDFTCNVQNLFFRSPKQNFRFENPFVHVRHLWASIFAYLKKVERVGKFNFGWKVVVKPPCIHVCAGGWMSGNLNIRIRLATTAWGQRWIARPSHRQFSPRCRNNVSIMQERNTFCRENSCSLYRSHEARHISSEIV